MSENDTTPKFERGELEAHIKAVVDDYVLGHLEDASETGLTPHAIAQQVAARTDRETVSAGAVTSTLKRWQKYGFALLAGQPLRFVGYTPAAEQEGLRSLKQKYQERTTESRRRSKVDADKPATPTAKTLSFQFPRPAPVEGAA